jgi:hypothetical protein
MSDRDNIRNVKITLGSKGYITNEKGCDIQCAFDLRYVCRSSCAAFSAQKVNEEKAAILCRRERHAFQIGWLEEDRTFSEEDRE